jgi:hypothetical protein
LIKLKIYITIIFFCYFQLGVIAQKKYYLKTNLASLQRSTTQDSIPSLFRDTFSLKKALATWQNQAVNQNYWEASIDSLYAKDSVYYAILHLGKQYSGIILDKGNVDKSILEAIGFRQKKFQQQPVSIAAIRGIQNRILTHLENNGYPLATIKMDSLTFNSRGFQAALFLDKGRRITFDGIELEEDSVKIALKFLENYLGLSPKTLFEQKKISNIKKSINELPYLTLEGDPYLSFSGDKAKVKMLLRKRNASRFDALLGLLPSENSATNKRNFAITGTLNLDLQNSLGKGERLLVDFQRLRASTQEIKVQAAYPYLFNFNIGADAALNIYKSDSTFTDIRLTLGLQRLFTGNNYIKVYWSRIQTNLGFIDTLALLNSRRLPDKLDLVGAVYGLEWQQQYLDYRLNPRKGWSLFLKGDFGRRKILKNNTIASFKDANAPDFDFATLYDTISLNALRFQGNISFALYLPLLQQSTIKFGLQAAGILSKTPIYQNEQFRLGGNRQLRGFDEASIFSSRYLLTTLEYRFLFGQNSYINVFNDVAYIENFTTLQQQIIRPISFGAGMTFETKAGLFSITYALGKNMGNAFDTRSGKIHFGYINVF